MQGTSPCGFFSRDSHTRVRSGWPARGPSTLKGGVQEGHVLSGLQPWRLKVAFPWHSFILNLFLFLFPFFILLFFCLQAVPSHSMGQKRHHPNTFPCILTLPLPKKKRLGNPLPSRKKFALTLPLVGVEWGVAKTEECRAGQSRGG